MVQGITSNELTITGLGSDEIHIEATGDDLGAQPRFDDRVDELTARKVKFKLDNTEHEMTLTDELVIEDDALWAVRAPTHGNSVVIIGTEAGR